MSHKEINVDALSDRLIDSLNEHKIGQYDQASALAIAFMKVGKRLLFTKGNAIDIMITTYDAYDHSDT